MNKSIIQKAAVLLREGKVVAIPTETVYGLAADATNAQAVARIFEIKGRPSFNPLITHFSDTESALKHIYVNEIVERLAKFFWPGPLTLVAKKKEESLLVPEVSAGLPHVGVRVPAHPLTHALLKCVERPLAAPSANPSQGISPTIAQHVRDYFEGHPDLAAILDGGACQEGLESTVVGIFDNEVVLLRPGSITVSALEEVLGTPVKQKQQGDVITSPGQMLRHYAPRRVCLRMNAQWLESDEAYLAFGPTLMKGVHTLNLSEAGDLQEAAHNLFAMLQALDCLDVTRVAVAPIPEEGVGLAINDRLRRACVDRDS